MTISEAFALTSFALFSVSDLRTRLVPGIESTPWTALAATWVSAVVGTLISWATTAGTDDGHCGCPQTSP